MFVHIHSHNRGKLDPCAVKCIFLGNSPNQKGYKCYSSVTKKFYSSTDVTFFESASFYLNTLVQGELSTDDDEPLYWEHATPSNEPAPEQIFPTINEQTEQVTISPLPMSIPEGNIIKDCATYTQSTSS